MRGSRTDVTTAAPLPQTPPSADDPANAMARPPGCVHLDPAVAVSGAAPPSCAPAFTAATRKSTQPRPMLQLRVTSIGETSVAGCRVHAACPCIGTAQRDASPTASAGRATRRQRSATSTSAPSCENRNACAAARMVHAIGVRAAHGRQPRAVRPRARQSPVEPLSIQPISAHRDSMCCSESPPALTGRDRAC
jgi:hypothetical protein